MNFKDFFHRCRRRVVAFEAEKKAEFIEASLNIALVLYLTQFMIASEVGRKYISDRNVYIIIMITSYSLLRYLMLMRSCYITVQF